MKHSEQIDQIADALAKAQAAIQGAKKDSANPFFKSKYADLTACWEACRTQLTSNGVAVVQGNVPHDGAAHIETMLVHKSGQWLCDDGINVPVSKNDAQGLGSAVTYARRYSLCAMVGVAPEDDDGNAAAQSKKNDSYSPSQLAMEQLSKKTQAALQKTAKKITTLLAADDAAGAYEIAAELDNDEKAALWSLLDSKQRKTLKEQANLAKETA